MSALDWVYPPRCMACGQIIAINDLECRARRLCGHCETLFEPITGPVCGRCGAPLETEGGACPACGGRTLYFTRGRSFFIYGGVMRGVIHDIKFRSRRGAAEGLGLLLAEAAGADYFKGCDMFAPVPLHKFKRRERGFNQAAILANALSKRFGLPALDALLRVRETPPQSGLSAERRAENVKGAFAVNKKIDIEDKYICLVDDIYTTGSTLNACAEALANAGAAGIICVTLSAAVKNSGSAFAR